jgi:hypothetical protein
MGDGSTDTGVVVIRNPSELLGCFSSILFEIFVPMRKGIGEIELYYHNVPILISGLLSNLRHD